MSKHITQLLQNETPTEPIPTAGIVAFSFDKLRVLMVRHTEKAGHHTGMYGIPAGRIKEKENALEAATREMFEETGIAINSLQTSTIASGSYTATIERKNGQQKFTLQTFALILPKEIQVRASEETEPEFIPIIQLHTLNLLPNMLKITHDAIKQLQI